LKNRDSELACLIQDTEKMKIKLGGKEIEVSKLAYELRANN